MEELTDVRAEHNFDQNALHEYLKVNLAFFSGNEGHLSISQYSAGQSNPTFCLSKNGKKAVMRKKPPGKLLKGAHQVSREFRILSALHSVSFPVPKPFLYCDDPSVTGTEFYVMEHVKGRIFRNPALPDLTTSEKRAIYFSMATTLARLHSIDWKSLGLSDFGHQGNPLRRQVSTWSKQYKAAATCDISVMDRLGSWLRANVPNITTKKTVIVHGDYRLDNLVIHPTKPDVIAVLDWELATLGDPILDLAYSCLQYHTPEELKHTSPFNLVSASDGVLSEEEYVSAYCESRKLKTPIENWNFYIALSFFRLAAISQGVYARGLAGNASAQNASLFGKLVEPIAAAGLRFTCGGGVMCRELKPGLDSISIFQPSSHAKALYSKMKTFMEEHIYPAEKAYYEHVSNPETQWQIPPIVEELKKKALSAGLWNLFLPAESGLSQLEYALLAELTGRSPIAPEVFNCSAPDSGNMEVLHLYGSDEQKKQWLNPLLRGEIRSTFCMTEPDVASSDATNMECEITVRGNQVLLNGRKWWSSGAGDPRCKVAIVMGRSGDQDLPQHRRHSMVIVPMDTPGLTKLRSLTMFGYNDAPHGHLELKFENVSVPLSNIILGVGRGFEIAQGRLGPGRIHHCMRAIGLAERALHLMVQRSLERVAFGSRLAEKGMVQEQIALSRIEIEQARLLVLKAAHTIDTLGNKAARKEIAMAKISVPRAACKVIDRAIQVHGGMGFCQDTPLAYFYAHARCLRVADGPDEVHLEAVAKLELKQAVQSKM